MAKDSMADRMVREAVDEAKSEQGTLGDGGFDVKSTAEEPLACGRTGDMEDDGVGGKLLPGK